MNLTIADLIADTGAFLGFALLFLPPGYLAASLLITGFRQRSTPEKILWAVVLSTPLSILISTLTGRYAPLAAGSAVFYLIAAAALVLGALHATDGKPLAPQPWRRSTTLATLAMAGLALYIALATVGIQVGHRLYEGTASGDWSVRVPLVASGIHGGVPPRNPFNGIDGTAPQLRYYYYWYVLCGQMGRILHIGPRSILTASAAWSGLAFFSLMFLCFKYLFKPTVCPPNRSIRRLCLLSLPVACIIGLDIIPAVLGLFFHPVKVFPEMEWWRAEGDFALSFHTLILYAPHHAAGFVCCMAAFLLLTMEAQGTVQNITLDNAQGASWRRRLFAGFVAGLCFAAAVGTSTYITLFFVVVCALLAAERIMMRDWRSVAAIVCSGLVAIALSASYIHEITSNPAMGSAAIKHSGRFVGFAVRNMQFSFIVLFHLLRNAAWMRNTNHLSAVTWLSIKTPLMIGLLATELGFFGFVLAFRLRTDWRNRSALTIEQRFQWILCITFGVFALFVTSAPVIHVNDLGRHAGFALRFIAVLWATPLVAEAIWGERPQLLMRHPWLRRIVLATIFLGLASQLWQIVIQRTFLMLVDTGHLVAREPFPPFRNIGARYYDLRLAYRALDDRLAPEIPVQFNPLTKYRAAMTIYLDRPVAAGDSECMTSFGGDPTLCKAAMPALQALFGGSNGHEHTMPFNPARVTPDSFAAICTQHRLSAIIATASDRVWPEKSSWVWNEPVLYANSTTRVLACPVTPVRPMSSSPN